MTPIVFTKHYATAEARARAERNHAWLTQHATPLHLPKIIHSTPSQLTFEYVQGRHARPSDLPALATHLGAAHATAWTRTLSNVSLATPHTTGEGHTLPGFLTPRLATLTRRFRSGHAHLHDVLLYALRLTHWASHLPAAFYKDANPRNILITPSGDLVTVDTDDLTLAPFGYDLSKLVVALAMTHGPLPRPLLTEARAAYNNAAMAHHPRLHVTHRQLRGYADLHGILTAPYLGQGGYRWPWHHVRS